MKGPWYMLMYYSALCHMAAALILIVIWRKKLGYQKVKSLLEILLISGAGVVIQLLYHPLLTTGFGMSLGILVLFITINNPHANIDTLTGLYNHLYLARKSNELISAGKSFHIITVYLYQLKHINKIAGVQGGNSILKLTARKLGEMCGKKAFRTTGKSFMILTGSLEEYEYYLTQLKRMFDGNSKLNVNNKIITMPVIISGIMNAQKLGDSGLILEYAEYLEALSAKNGLTEVIQDDYQTMNGFLYNKRVEQYLHKAITEDLFEIYYQPVYSTRKKCFITLEALSRLQHPELGWIAPDVFIQIAEKNHMIEQITDLQFSRVCRFLGENRYLMRHLLNVKVNLSSLDLMRNDCSRHFIRIMDAYKIPHNWIQFEITETVATECNAGLRRVAEEFTDAGIGLCLDDFGSGYANLNTVMRLPFSVIKVDRSLLFDICRDEKRAIFYESVVETFHKMNYHIVSEGVETQEEMEQIGAQIRARDEVSEAKFISADEAWAEWAPENIGEDYNEIYTENPLEGMDNYEIYMNDVSKQESLVSWLESIPQVERVRYSEVAATTLTGVNALVAYTSVGIIAILLAVSVFLINNTVMIGISVRKSEIEIMKYIGATDFFVRSPFVIEGILIGLIGSLLPLGLIYVLYKKVIDYVMIEFPSLSGLMQFLPVSEIYRTLLPVCLGLGAGIGFLGSFITVRKHLRV